MMDGTNSNGDVDIFVGPDSMIEGKIVTKGQVTIAGSVKGDVECSVIVIQEGGDMKGNTSCDKAEIAGSIADNVIVGDLLMVRSAGLVTGEIKYGTLEVEKGGKINGNISANSKEITENRIHSITGNGERGLPRVKLASSSG